MEKIGPYQIHEQLGAGGMGEVFKAFDDRLDRWVAIKRIRGDKEGIGEHRERFQREARATAKLNHVSIVHLYDIFRDGDNDCIVMEYIEGRSLDRLITHGPLEPAQVAALGHQVASGLAEAHAKGIIHRDLKVENIIITPEGHAKILDFGLARPLLSSEFDASLTGKGQLVGTSRAMSPEYVSGETIDHRSDLFSLGVLLYEAATSHSPFRAHNTLATLKQVMLHHQTPAHVVNTEMPEDLSTVIESLLEKDPADRPQSAQQVSDELRRLSGHLSSASIARPGSSSAFLPQPTEILTPTATSVDIWARRRWLAAPALVVLALALTYLLTLLVSSRSDDIEEVSGGLTFNERDRIVLADFENRTGELLSVELAFRVGLEQSRYASVLPKAQVRAVLERMELDPRTPIDRELGIEICRREGARALVLGAMVKVGEVYSLSAEIVDPSTGIGTFSTAAHARGQDEILPKLAQVTQAIRKNLGESLAAIEDSSPLEKVTTPNLEALTAYSLGIDEIDESDSATAIPLFEQALKLDPHFAMAHAKLASIYIHRNDRTQALEHLDQALRHTDRLTEFEKLYVQGWAARWQGRPDDVIDAWSLMSTLFPRKATGHLNLGMIRWHYLNEFGKAAESFSTAAEVAAPEYLSRAFFRLGYCQLALERYEESLASFKRVSASSQARSHLYLILGKHAEALSILDSAADPSRDSQLRSRLMGDADQGRFEDALREVRELLTGSDPGSSNLGFHLTKIVVQEQAAVAELAETLAAADRAARALFVSTRAKTDTFAFKTMAMIGKLNARNSAIGSAEALSALISPLAEKKAIAIWRTYARMLEGEILAARGEIAAAIVRFEEALSIADSFQLRESLARAYETAGRTAEATEEYGWILEHRGWGFVECRRHCEVASLVDWALASYHLGRLREKQGNRQEAMAHYRRFLDHWRQGGDLAVLQDARSRLAGLSSAEQLPPEAVR